MFNYCKSLKEIKINFRRMKHFFLISMIFFSGCYSQGIFVYEKIPKAVECYSFKDYFDIEICNRKQQIILSDKLVKVIEIDNSRKIFKID